MRAFNPSFLPRFVNIFHIDFTPFSSHCGKFVKDFGLAQRRRERRVSQRRGGGAGRVKERAPAKVIWNFLFWNTDYYENRAHVHVGKKSTEHLCKKKTK